MEWVRVRDGYGQHWKLIGDEAKAVAELAFINGVWEAGVRLGGAYWFIRGPLAEAQAQVEARYLLEYARDVEQSLMRGPGPSRVPVYDRPWEES